MSKSPRKMQPGQHPHSTAMQRMFYMADPIPKIARCIYMSEMFQQMWIDQDSPNDQMTIY